ncbi:type II secretion system minor pseudopilin GspI [Paraburkholderia sp. Ac-20347]|jgi:general secretion pathway protein I|uniref:type II secretion system minor pseudopilin GspI n=1 Tax=Paraburkholderia sp. Ac-20347 TaxID=2703892 RepID=UPI00197D698C|nr:type II secretion system minor pseudopilin GspI [Paraburkholderia sp. Ac-20347]MBN3808313.1 type II secretion system minor pseudopilin GspI [Paraburkholderia sp. Ac-20347]
MRRPAHPGCSSPRSRASRRASSRTARGFTMIEVLVALAIVAIALAASLRAVGSLAASEADLHDRLLAGWSADNALAQLHLAHVWPDVGQRSFDCSQGNLTLMCTQRVASTPNPVFRRVEVSVTTPGRAGNLAQLVTVIGNETNRSL